MVAAMGLTLISDYFLILENKHVAGVFVFCLVHLVYISRVKDLGIKVMVYSVAALVLFMITANLPALVLVYAGLFIKNIEVNFKHRYFNRKLIIAGLILFALCDINVLMYNLPRYIQSVPENVAGWGYTLIWFFYVPSQFLLCISSVRFTAGQIHER